MLPFRSGRFRQLGAAGSFLFFVLLVGATLRGATKAEGEEIRQSWCDRENEKLRRR